MILFVDIEAYGESLPRPLARMWAEHTLRAAWRIEDVADTHVLVVRHDRFDPDMPARLGARAVVFGGHMSEVSRYAPGALDGARAFARHPDRPLLGVCGGHQLIAEAHGGRAGPMCPQADPERDLPCVASADLARLRHETPQGRFGYLSVERTGDHPYLAGLSARPRFLHMHRWHVAEMPEGFDVIGRSRDGTVQAMVHRALPITGTQFHPEGYTDAHPDGAALLRRVLAEGGAIHAVA